VEVFGDDGLISTQDRRLGALRVGRSLRLLDLRGAGAWKAGATQAICSCLSRSDSQQWARYFHSTYPELEGSSMATPTTVQTPWPCLSEPMAP
jgi:hypothetical protein